MVLEKHMKLCVTEPDILEKIAPKRKRARNRFFESIELDLFSDENLYYLVLSFTNSIFVKNFVPEKRSQPIKLQD